MRMEVRTLQEILLEYFIDVQIEDENGHSHLHLEHVPLQGSIYVRLGSKTAALRYPPIVEYDDFVELLRRFGEYESERCSTFCLREAKLDPTCDETYHILYGIVFVGRLQLARILSDSIVEQVYYRLSSKIADTVEVKSDHIVSLQKEPSWASDIIHEADFFINPSTEHLEKSITMSRAENCYWGESIYYDPNFPKIILVKVFSSWVWVDKESLFKRGIEGINDEITIVKNLFEH